MVQLTRALCYVMSLYKQIEAKVYRMTGVTGVLTFIDLIIIRNCFSRSKRALF